MPYPHQLPSNSSSPPITTQGNNSSQQFLVFGPPCASWEQTRDALITIGVPHDELGAWYNLYLWGDIQKELQNGWDPRSEIEKYLTPFFEYLGDRKFRCVAPMRDGKPGEMCGWEGAKRDRTVSHVCGHLNYNAWICNGKCGQPECTQRFSEKRNLDQHAKAEPVQCTKCHKPIGHKRNLKKHMAKCS